MIEMGKDVVFLVANPDEEVTQHTHPAAYALMIALAFHCFDQDFTGRVPQKKLMRTARLTPKTFYRALREVECSTEVLFYTRPGKPCAYFMAWAYDVHMANKGEAPPRRHEWPEQFQRLGHKCPRPTRIVYQDKHSDRISYLRERTDAERREARKARQG